MQRRRIAPDVFEPVTFVHLFAERAIFLLKFAALHRARDQQFDFVEVQRLGDEIVSAAFHRLDCDIDRAVSGHHDADRRTRHFQCAIDQGHSIFAAEAEVSKKHIDLLALQHVHRAAISARRTRRNRSRANAAGRRAYASRRQRSEPWAEDPCPRPGSQLKEFKAVGPIDAPTGAVCAVIDDFQNYPKFMPYTTECRLIKRDGDSIVGYQRLSPKVCADRDYTLRVWKKSWPSTGGLVFMSHWSPANDLGPPEKKGVVRVKLCEGKWLLEPDGATKTRATYFIYTDTGGFIPSFIANRISVTGITKLFAAVRKQVKDPKKKPVATEYHGVTVEDPYQWLEKDDDSQVKAWSDAQNQQTRKYLDSFPDRAAIEKQLQEWYAKTSPSYSRSSRGPEFCSR
jgi:hypothetical protein